MATATQRREAGGAWMHGLDLPIGGWAGAIVAAFGAYYIVPGTPLSLLLLAVCGVLCYLRLGLAVSLVPLAMPYFMLPKALGHQHFALGETAIVLCVAAYLARAVTDPPLASPDAAHGLAALARRLVPASAFGRVIAVFLVAATAATLAAHMHTEARREFRLDIVEPIAYYVLVVATLREATSMLRALWATVGAGLAVALLGIGQYLFRQSTLTGAYFTGSAAHPVRHPLHQITAVYGSPDNVGLLLDRALPVAVVLGLAALPMAVRRVGRGGRQGEGTGPSSAAPATAGTNPWWLAGCQVTAWGGAAVMVAALVLTGSRGGIIVAVAVAIGAALAWRLWPAAGAAAPARAGDQRAAPARVVRPGSRRLPLAVAGVAVIALTGGLVLSQVRHGLSTRARLYVWTSAVSMIRDHPLLGVGPDNFLYYYFDPRARDRTHPETSACVPPGRDALLPARHYLDRANAWQEPCLSHPHNAVLDAWLSTGLLGLLALSTLCIAAALTVARTLRQAGSGPVRTVILAAAAVMTATVAHGLVDNSIFVPDLAVDFWLALALISNGRLVPSALGEAPGTAAGAIV